jgi:hypothetical protein
MTQQEEADAVDFTEIKTSFLENYGVSVDLPGFYIQDSKMWPGDPDFCIQVIRYSIPTAKEGDEL